MITGYIPHSTIKPQVLAEYLRDYPNLTVKNKLISGFTQGFSIGCHTQPSPRPPPSNNKNVLDKPHIAQDMVNEEIRLGRMLGPYDGPPVADLICSPLNLVPKAGDSSKHRLIHNLAHPYDENSINANIPDSEAVVSYIKFDEVIKLALKHGPGAVAAKVDYDAAFRLFPICAQDLPLLGFTLNGKFYINSSMAFGSRSSCKIFEEFAVAMQWCMEQITQSKDISHYLDDFIMVHKNFHVCQSYMNDMQAMCDHMGAPLSEKKTVGPVHIITFLGLLIDLIRQMIQIPKDKVEKAVHLLTQIVESKNSSNSNQRGKITVKLLQQTTGTLNFFCRAIPSGRPFIGRLYKAIASVTADGRKPNPKFKVRVNKGMEEDTRMWLKFLTDPTFAQHREIPFTTFLGRTEDGPLIYADSAGCATKGFGCIFPEKGLWTFGAWPREFFIQRKPNIMLLELYAIVVAVDMWAPLLRNKHVRLRSDNMSSVYELNKKSSRKTECMALLRHLTHTCLSFQIYVTARHEPGKQNVLSDILSRGKVKLFREKTKGRFRANPTPLTSSLVPISWKKLD